MNTSPKNSIASDHKSSSSIRDSLSNKLPQEQKQPCMMSQSYEQQGRYEQQIPQENINKGSNIQVSIYEEVIQLEQAQQHGQNDVIVSAVMGNNGSQANPKKNDSGIKQFSQQKQASNKRQPAVGLKETSNEKQEQNEISKSQNTFNRNSATHINNPINDNANIPDIVASEVSNKVYSHQSNNKQEQVIKTSSKADANGHQNVKLNLNASTDANINKGAAKKQYKPQYRCNDSQCISLITEQTHCIRHPHNFNPSYLYVCLQPECHDAITNSSQRSNQRRYSQTYSQSQSLKSKSSPKTSDQKIKYYTKQESRILCHECLNQQLHRGHQICTLTKFQEIICGYHWASVQASKTLLSKIGQLKHNLEHFLLLLGAKAVDVMTLGLKSQQQDYRIIHSHRHTSKQTYIDMKKMENKTRKNIQSKNLQNIIQGNAKYSQENNQEQLSNLETVRKQKISPVYDGMLHSHTHAQNYNYNSIEKNVDNIFSKTSLQVWQQIISNSKYSLSPLPAINKILSFKEESISEQIQDIHETFEQSINDAVANLQFINSFKDWIFNPDDMHADSVGLTLDRNKLEAVTISGLEPYKFQDNCMKIEVKDPIKVNQPNEEGMSNLQLNESIDFETNNVKQSKQKLKAAFTQSAMLSETSRSFRVERIKEAVMMGCADSQVHSVMGAKLNYEGFEHLIYGVLVTSGGIATLFNKGQSPRILPNTLIQPNDIIQLTFHSKQNTLILTKFSSVDETDQKQPNKDNMKSMYTSLAGNIHRTIIATLSVQQTEEQIMHPFAAVSTEGDCVRITQNIKISNKISNEYPHSVSESIEILQKQKQKQIDKESARTQKDFCQGSNSRIAKFKQAQAKKAKQKAENRIKI